MKTMRRALIISLLLSSLASVAQSPDSVRRRICPPFLREGDKVAVISPGYAPSVKTDTTVSAACRILKQWGLQPVFGNYVYHPDTECLPQLGMRGRGLDERLSDIRWALRDTSVKAIIPSRGGYGGIHLVDSLSLDDFRSNPKWLTGYSDITNLHLASVAAGVMSIHGNMCYDLARKGADDAGTRALHALLFGELPVYGIPAHRCDIPGHAEGVLVGGNMITLAALTGTSWDFPVDEPCILFLEEIEETMHAVDRLFRMLEKQGRFSNVKAIVFGGFTGCRTDLGYDSIEDLLHECVLPLGIPVCFGFPAGHVQVNYPLIEGARAILDINSSGTKLEFVL